MMDERLDRENHRTSHCPSRSLRSYDQQIHSNMSASNQPPTSERLMVSLIDSSLPIRQGQRFTLTKFSCGAQPTSLFLQVPRQTGMSSVKESSENSHQLCELQSVPVDFGSFLVTPTNTLIGKDSNLYVTTPVDPLFFILQHEPASTQWQPWDQIVEGMGATERSILPEDSNQLMHLFTRMPVSDDETYYKFSVTKALSWLQQKFKRVQETLERQCKEAQKSNGNSNGRSSMASNFNVGNQATGSNTMSEQELKTEQEKLQATRDKRISEKCQAEALQIICDYLNETWKLRFLNHVDLDASLLEPKKAPKPSEKRPAPTDFPVPEVKKQKAIVKTTSVALKKLAKVNTNGMKKMSAFFTKKENVKNPN